MKRWALWTCGAGCGGQLLSVDGIPEPECSCGALMQAEDPHMRFVAEHEAESLRTAGQALADSIRHMARERPVLDECHYALDIWDSAFSKQRRVKEPPRG